MTIMTNNTMKILEMSTTPSNRSGEKTVPFLRQLTLMLRNNAGLISFVPGKRYHNDNRKGNNIPPTTSSSSTVVHVHGQIIIHDRQRVQDEVLPTYFNHASFASLRRQLSYFSFLRVGKKGKQQLAGDIIYIHENVVEIEDICKLQRRRSDGAAAAAHSATTSGGGKTRKADSVIDVDSKGEKLLGSEQQQQHPEDKQGDEDNIRIHSHAASTTEGLVAPPKKKSSSLRSNNMNIPRMECCNTEESIIASAMLSGTLHAATDNDTHSDRNAVRTKNNKTTKNYHAREITRHDHHYGRLSNNDDDDDNVSSSSSPFSSSSDALCSPDHRPIHQKKQRTHHKPSLQDMSKQIPIQKSYNSRQRQRHHHLNRRRLPMTLPSTFVTSSDALKNHNYHPDYRKSRLCHRSTMSATPTPHESAIIHRREKHHNHGQKHDNNSNIHDSSSSKNSTTTTSSSSSSSNNLDNKIQEYTSWVTLPKKNQERFHKLLSINAIVPFIHLPTTTPPPSSSLTQYHYSSALLRKDSSLLFQPSSGAAAATGASTSTTTVSTKKKKCIASTRQQGEEGDEVLVLQRKRKRNTNDVLISSNNDNTYINIRENDMTILPPSKTTTTKKKKKTKEEEGVVTPIPSTKQENESITRCQDTSSASVVRSKKGRERSSSDCVVTALLALSSDRVQ